ncbi:Uma2 family endonuclease [Polyangium jinanense]|uniref:Uma2 family endonuclease n=1 Tax=Polyangium jinanense TaxID=2829994 RepID=A0A9X3WY18_9BACT|nr:Uma2 family endonuclease [Polyangium jinanense]MDC3953564.1 Uma2 family endonuclease [Polyangium jinanense]MDC3979315.1 Uma2 family endonuclease [Polyangium jinanense]
MNEPAHKLKYTFAEYIAYDEASETKHEFLDGEIYAMAGGTGRHSLLTTAMSGELRIALRSRPCRVFSPDMRLRVQETGLATYPDVAVVCGHIGYDPESATTYTNPIVLVEVLSPSTERYDGIYKLDHYLRIPTLREYLLVSQNEPHIQHYTRNEDDSWTFRHVRPPQPLKLPSVDVTLSLDDIYRGVFDP